MSSHTGQLDPSSMPVLSPATTAAEGGARDAASNVNMVASASDELRDSIEGIARQTDDSRRIAREASTQAEQTSALITKLEEASQRIGGVVELIGKIAGGHGSIGYK